MLYVLDRTFADEVDRVSNRGALSVQRIAFCVCRSKRARMQQLPIRLTQRGLGPHAHIANCLGTSPHSSLSLVQRASPAVWLRAPAQSDGSEASEEFAVPRALKNGS